MDPRTFKEMRFIFSFNLCGSRGGPAWYRLGDVKRPTSVSRDSETQRLVVGGNSVPSSLSVAGGTHSKCSGCGLQRFPSIFSRNLTQLGNAVEWRFSAIVTEYFLKKRWRLEYLNLFIFLWWRRGVLLGGVLAATAALQRKPSKKLRRPQKSISSPTEFLWEYYGGRPGVYWAPAWALKWPII